MGDKSSTPEGNTAAYNFSTTSKGNIKAYDDRLASDGSALCDFLLTHVATPPKVFMNCKGVHYRDYTDGDGKAVREEIYDFKFTIDLSSLLVAETDPPPIFVLGDDDPAFRGRMSLAVRVSQPTPEHLEEKSARIRTRRATRDERKRAETRKAQLWSLGLPPWTHLTVYPLGMQAGVENDAVYQTLQNTSYLVPPKAIFDAQLRRSSRSLRDVADEFCASWKPLKEFRLRKSVYGWNISSMEAKVKEILWSNKLLPCTCVEVKVEVGSIDIVVRPDSFLWAVFTNGWFLFLAMITFIYPILIWPVKRFILGGKWWMAGCAYTFATFEAAHVEEAGQAGMEVETTSQRELPQVPSLEDAWLKSWEKAMVGIVLSKQVLPYAITDPSSYGPPVGRGIFRYQ